MRSWTIAFSLGAVLAARLPVLPEFTSCCLLLALALLLHLRRGARIVAAALLGASWLGCYANQALDERWPEPPFPRDAWVQATVWSLPITTDAGQRVTLRLERVCHSPSPRRCDFDALPFDGRQVQVSVYEPIDLKPGQRWQWLLRLRPPHGFVNPGGFDYEAWLLQQRISATGHVRPHPDNRLLTASPARRLEQGRWWVAREIAGIADGTLRWPHLLRALTIGDGSGLQDEEWELLAATGTTHLLVISGSHVVLIGLLCYQLGYWLGTRSHWLLMRCPATWPAACIALLGSWCYTGLAGFSLPACRAWLMIAVVLVARLARRQLHPWNSLCLALAVVLAWDPLATLNAGFWLSFAAVAVLLHADSSPSRDAGWRRWWGEAKALWHLQWRISLALLPIVMVFFQQTSVLALFVNLPLIPLLGLLVVPLALSGVVGLWCWPPAGTLLLQIADRLLSVTMALLSASVAALPHALIDLPTLTMPALLLFSLVAIATLLARQRWQRWCAVAALPIIGWAGRPAPLPTGAVEVRVLDVGQGLAVLIKTRDHAMLYDAGPRFSDRFEAGDDVIVPALRHANLASLDLIMISHGDQDHAGGLAAVRRHSPQAIVSSSASELPGMPVPPERCRAGQAWQWNAVRFEVLHPDTKHYDDNNGSCVLLISAGEQQLLLTGDIEANAEKQLRRRYPTLRASIVVAPHHGSKSSSSAPFVRQLQPRWVVFSSGYQNRYGHPAETVRQRYIANGATSFTTATDGAVRFIVRPGTTPTASGERTSRRRFWRASQQPVAPELERQ